MDKDELLSILRTFENDFDKLNDALIDEILKYVNEGMSPADAADKVLNEESYFGLLLPLILGCIVSSIFLGAGIKNPVPEQKKEIERIIKNHSWGSDGINLATRFKSMQETMKQVMKHSVLVSQRQINTVKENVSGLLNYFRRKEKNDRVPEEKSEAPTSMAEVIKRVKISENVLLAPTDKLTLIQQLQTYGQPYKGLPAPKALADELPQYLKRLEQSARKLAAGDSRSLKEYQLALRKAEREIKKFEERHDKGKTPNQDLSGDYGNVISACEKLVKQTDEFTGEALNRSIEQAVKQRMKYYASRITRTESAAAWFDGFIAKYQDDPEVVAYRWRLHSRHHLVQYDQCDVCANMDVGYGKGIYPKNMVPSIPWHPHCMCTLVPVRVGDIAEDVVFDAGKARSYLDSLTDKQKKALFGHDGAEKYKKGGDWQKLLRGWDGFIEPTSRFTAVQFKNPAGDAYKAYTREQIIEMANDMRMLADKYTENETKWSGNIVLSKNGLEAKLWNCDIALRFETCNHLILHEQLHAHSASYHNGSVYRKFARIEEASVQLFNQEISKNEKIAILESGYDDMVKNLRYINNKAAISSNDFDFAKILFHIPLPKRLDWLYDNVYEKMMKRGKIEDIEELNNIL